MELGYLHQSDKGSILSSFYYRHTNGVIERIIISDSIGITHRFPVNLATGDYYGIEFSGSYQPFKWWSLSGSYNFYKSVTTGHYEEQDFFTDDFAWKGRLSSKWTFNRKLGFQTSFKYRSARETPQGKNFPMYNLDAGFSIDVLKGNGTVTFSGRDILNTRKHHSISVQDTFTAENEFQWHSRQFTIRFNYRLNQKKKRGERGGEGNYEEELNMEM